MWLYWQYDGIRLKNTDNMEVDWKIYWQLQSNCIIDIFLVTTSSYHKTKYGNSTVQKEVEENMDTHDVIAK